MIIDTENNIISTEDNTDIEENHNQGSLILKRSWSGITNTKDNRDLCSYLYKRLLILKIIVIIYTKDILGIKYISYHSLHF